MRVAAALGAVALAEIFFDETFDTKDWASRWVTSTWKGGNGPAGEFDYTAGQWFGDEAESMGIATSKDFHYHSISSKLAKPFSNKGKQLVLQYTVKQGQKLSSFCGGGYIKLLGADIDQENFGGDTDYSIMFGPDVCGYDVSRIHAIFNFKGENLLRTEDIKLNYDDKDEFAHLYTLVVNADNTYEVFFDKKSRASGKLHDDWAFPQKTKDDAADTKPSDWVEQAKIVDADDKQPADWQTEEKIADPDASKPEGWDDEEDGEWEAPMVDNLEYKGTWVARKIDNPEYKGVWKPAQIDNADFVEDVYGYGDLGAVGFELWTVNSGTIFDNILVTDSLDEAWAHAAAHWEKAQAGEKEAKEAFDKANAPPAEEAEEDLDIDDDDEIGLDELDEDDL